MSAVLNGGAALVFVLTVFAPAQGADMTRYETVTLTDAPKATINLAYRPGVVAKHPVILMLGSIERGKLPSSDLKQSADRTEINATQHKDVVARNSR